MASISFVPMLCPQYGLNREVENDAIVDMAVLICRANPARANYATLGFCDKRPVVRLAAKFFDRC